MKHFLFFVIAILFSAVVLSQEQREVYRINPGQDMNEVIKGEVKYLYPEFRHGSVLFRNGNFGSSKMNYSYLHQELQFIKGSDTLALDRGQDIQHVIIEKDTFYFRDKFWIRQVASNGLVRMAESKNLAFANREKIGAFGQPNSGSSIDAVENLVTVTNLTRKLESNQIITFAMSYTYYFSDRFDNYKPASRKTIVNMFGTKCPGLEKFLESEKINYKSGADVRKVYDYIVTHIK